MVVSRVRGCSQRGVIYPRTSKADLEKGIPIITRAEGVRLFDQAGRQRYCPVKIPRSRPSRPTSGCIPPSSPWLLFGGVERVVAPRSSSGAVSSDFRAISCESGPRERGA